MQFVEIILHVLQGKVQVLQVLLDDYGYVPFGQELEVTQKKPDKK